MGGGKKKMKKVFVLGTDKVGWSIDNDRENIKHIFSYIDNIELTENIFVADVIYCVWYNILLSKKYLYLIKMLKKIKDVKIITNITNDLGYDKNMNNFNTLRSMDIVDSWVVANKSTYVSLYDKIEGIDNKKIYHIPYYVDDIKFHRSQFNKKVLCKLFDIKYKEIKDKILIGSFQRDSEGKNLLEPKWQKGPEGLIEVMKDFKDKAILILAGPRRHWIINECIKNEIPYIFAGDKSYIDNMEDDIKFNNSDDKYINLLYNLVDIYLVTSKSESGPKAILESSLSKTLILSTPVGLAPDMLHNNLIMDVKDMRKNLIKIYNKRSKYIKYNYNKVIEQMDIRKLKKQYREIIERWD